MVVAAHTAGIARVDVSHARLPTDDRGRLDERTASAVMVEQLLEQLINVRAV
jgi:hypothetical protein